MKRDLRDCGISTAGTIHWNLPTPRLYEEIFRKGEGLLAEGGSIVVSTEPHTGRSPADKFIVDDPGCHDHVAWGDINHPLSPEHFAGLQRRLLEYLQDKDLYVQDCLIGSGIGQRLPIRIISETAWHSLLARSLFMLPAAEDAAPHTPEYTVIAIPSFQAIPQVDGTRSAVGILVNFTDKLILIAGTSYGGEIKKALFTVMNYLLPLTREALPMHCAANVGTEGDTTLFFGLSGTGKTTLSADRRRSLIGDDEHGWDDDGIFNFEGGCYAKVINLSRNLEPEIFACTRRFGTVMENVVIDPESRQVDLNNASITENTRAFYPLDFIPNAVPSATGNHPRTIMMLTCDAFGVLPPIARLTAEQAMYHFLSGYTAKLAGTEDGMAREPHAVFSSCFGAPFLPLRPLVYAELLREKIDRHGVTCWLVNTGWSGGGYGVGQRIRIDHTRAMINAALEGDFEDIPFAREPFFNLHIPTVCPGVPAEILNPRSVWQNKELYEETALTLIDSFRENFKQFATNDGVQFTDIFSVINRE
jgi:phosphoenolpyruvate carboxykinase (ATP)